MFSTHFDKIWSWHLPNSIFLIQYVYTGIYKTFYNLRVVGNFLKHFPFINQFAITSKVALCRSIKYSILVSSHISSKSSWLKILSDRARIFLKSSWNRCPATFITGQSLSKASKNILLRPKKSYIMCFWMHAYEKHMDQKVHSAQVELENLPSSPLVIH